MTLEKLFGSMSKTEKDYEVLIQRRMIQKGLQICLEKGDMKSYSSLLRENRLLQGLDKENNGDLTPEMLGGNTIVIHLAGDKASKTVNIDSIQETDPADKEEILKLADVTNLDDDQVIKLLTLKDEADSK